MMDNIEQISKILVDLKSEEDANKFLTEIFTENELKTLSKRWRILNMLHSGYSQRVIAKELSVGLCKITRGSKILKDKNAVCTRYLIKENKND